MKSLVLLPVLVVACASGEDSSSSASLTQPPGQCGDIETHVFGVHQAPGGEVTIHIDRPGHHALVVSAYERVQWTITTSPDAVVDGVYAVGYGTQSVVAADGVKVARDSKEQGGPYACGYTWPYDGGSCNTEELVNLSSKIINHAATSFHGCYEAASFSVAEDMAVSASCPDLAEYAACAGPDSCGGPILL
jgi:hypothetical protein